MDGCVSVSAGVGVTYPEGLQGSAPSRGCDASRCLTAGKRNESTGGRRGGVCSDLLAGGASPVVDQVRDPRW